MRLRRKSKPTPTPKSRSRSRSISRRSCKRARTHTATTKTSAEDTKNESMQDAAVNDNKPVAVANDEDLGVGGAVMARMEGQSRFFSKRAMDEAQKQFEKLGLNKSNLADTLEYIRTSAPLIVHIHPTRVLAALLRDTHYRSQFETGTTSGLLSLHNRRSWEETLFGHMYGKHGVNVDRPKYGCLNIFNNPNGDGRCSNYGDSYLLLKPHMRSRVTWTTKDSSYVATESNPDVHIGTLEHCAHLLIEMDDEDLKRIVALAVNHGKQDSSPSKRYRGDYCELQIHGPFRLDRDVQAIVLNHKYHHPEHKEIQNAAEQFARRNNCQLLWTSAVLDT